MTFHVPEGSRIRTGKLASSVKDGCNGAFQVRFGSRMFNMIASDGGGWEHVSVTLASEERCPTWDEMCRVKAIFWDAEDCVVQYHPPKSEYVNNHPRCLHLWRPRDYDLPTPPKVMV